VLKPVPEAFALNSPAIDGTGKKHDGRARQYRPHRKQDLEAGPRAAARAERLKAAGSGQARRPPFGKAAKGVMPLPRRQGPGRSEGPGPRATRLPVGGAAGFHPG